jgi:hypothetical protein
MQQLLWAPQPGPQQLLIRCPAREVLFGGTRGGGKTDGVLGRRAIRQKRLGRRMNSIIFRQEMPQSDDMLDRAQEMYRPMGASFNKVKSQFIFQSGARLRFRPLESIADAAKYQGQNLSDADIEEAGNYPDPAPIDRLWGAIRGDADGFLGMTANPGGPGQSWLRERFVTPWPAGMKILRVTLPNGAIHTRCYIPSKVTQNRALLSRDPDYVNRLYLVGSAALVRAWLEGDWNAIEGAFFDNWSAARHILEPFDVPQSWLRFRSYDHGYASPFSVGWWAVVADDHWCRNAQGDSVVLPRGALIRYREWYGVDRDWTGATKPNVGIRLDAERIATGIKEREAGEVIAYGVADPSIFQTQGGPSIGEQMIQAGVYWRQADNKRVQKGGPISGWNQMRTRLTGDEDGRPMIACFATCQHSIRTIPNLPHDPDKLEDLDTDAEDHAADDWRYACMSRPWTPTQKGGDRPKRDPYEEPEETSNWKTQ